MVNDIEDGREDTASSIHGSRFTIRDLPKALIAGQVCLAASVAPWYSAYGLHIDWRSAALLPLAHVALLATWWYCRRRYSTHTRKAIYADVLLATLVLLLATNIASPAQYLAVALRRPLIDNWLTGADAALGFDVAALATWTRAHPSISLLFSACYASLIAQFLMPLLIVGLRDRDRARLWEYVFHFNFCLIVTIAALAIFPAECPYTYLGFTPTIDQSRVIAHIAALRAGTFHTIDFGNLDGLVSMPSFHAAGGIMVTWTFRRHRVLGPVLVVLNTGLIAATFMSGVHYFVDIVGAFVLFAASVAAFRLVTRAPAAAPSEVPTAAWTPLRWPRAARTSPD